MNRFMIRMIRVSKIPVWYSEGFNPHPYVTFALPLSLGFESSYEIVDIRLDDDKYSNQEVFDSLKAVLPPDIKLIKAADPIMKAGDIGSAEFLITFDCFNKTTKEKLIEFLGGGNEILIEKKSKKGKINTIDISKMIFSSNLCDKQLKLRLAAGGSENLNPKLLLEAYCQKFGPLPSLSVKRTMIFSKNNDEFK